MSPVIILILISFNSLEILSEAIGDLDLEFSDFEQTLFDTADVFERVLADRNEIFSAKSTKSQGLLEKISSLEERLDLFERKLKDVQVIEYYVTKEDNISSVQYFTSDSNVTIVKGDISTVVISLKYGLESLSSRLDSTSLTLSSIPQAELKDVRLIFMKNLLIDKVTCDHINVTIINNRLFQPENIFSLNREEYVNGCIKVNTVNVDWVLTEHIGYDFTTQKGFSLSDLKSIGNKQWLQNVTELSCLRAKNVKFKRKPTIQANKKSDENS